MRLRRRPAKCAKIIAAAAGDISGDAGAWPTDLKVNYYGHKNKMQGLLPPQEWRLK
jgi:hypothetical protein